MQNYTPIEDGNRSTIQTDQVPISDGNYSVTNSDSWLFSQNSLPVNSHWTSMSTDIDSSADCEVPEGQNFHQKLMTASERIERMQETMDDLEAKFQEITKYISSTKMTSFRNSYSQVLELLRENSSSSENEIEKPVAKEWHTLLNTDIRDHLVRKLINAIIPSTSSCEERIAKMLDVYARKVENECWETANSKSEYYHFLAEKYYKIQTKISERRRQRMIARRL